MTEGRWLLLGAAGRRMLRLLAIACLAVNVSAWAQETVPTSAGEAPRCASPAASEWTGKPPEQVGEEATVYFARGCYAAAADRWLHTLGVRRAMLAPGHPDITADLIHLGNVLSALGKYAEALQYLQEGLALRRQTLPPGHPDIARSLFHLGVLQVRTGQFAEATSGLEQALAIQEMADPPVYKPLADTLNVLGVLHHLAGRYPQAIARFQEALAVNAKAEPRDYPGMARMLDNVAASRTAMGEVAAALDLHKQALELRIRVLPAGHPDIGNSLTNVGYAHERLGQYRLSLQHYEESLALTKQALGSGHPDVATDLNNLGATLHALAQYPQALQRHEEALAIRRRALPPGHPFIAISLLNAAAAHREMGQFEQAAQILKEGLASTPDVPETADLMAQLGLVYRAMGRLAEARDQLDKALRHWENTAPADDPRVALALSSLGDVHDRSHAPDLSLALTQQAFGLLSTQDQPAQLCEVAAQLGHLYRKRAASDLAIFYYKQAVNACQTIRQHAVGLDRSLLRSLDGKVTPTYAILVRILGEQGRLAEAAEVEQMLKEAAYHAFFERSLPHDPRRTRIALTAEEEALRMRLDTLQANSALLRRRIREAVSAASRTALQQDLQALQRRTVAVAYETGRQWLKGADRDAVRLLHSDTAFQQRFRPLLAGWERAKESGGERAAMLSIVPLETHTWIVLVTRNGYRRISVPAGEARLNGWIRDLALEMDGRAARGSTSGYRPSPASQRLYEHLIAPVEDLLRRERVAVVVLDLPPYGALRSLPFAALHDRRENRYFVDKYASAIHAGTEAAEENTGEHWSAAAAGVARSGLPYPPLPNVERELCAVVHDAAAEPACRERGMLPGKRFLDGRFSKTVLFDLLNHSRYEVIHLASHFRLDAANASRSSLLLGGDEEVSLLQLAADLTRTGRPHALITLSACQTATAAQSGGRTREEGLAGAGLESLAALLLEQSAQAILATLWKLDDQGALHAMQGFYQARGERRQMSKAAALRQAQLAVRRKAGSAHPYHWAPFVLMGAWR
jgi:CHAT domain-containing protein/Tfp pilus assembly protein PilF